MADQRAVGPAFLHGGLSPQEAASGLADRLGHRMRDATLLGRALTHASAQAGATYQRLEFLGDRVLGLVIADLLYAAFPHAEEGELSPRLTRLVRRETCAEVADAWNVAPHVRLGSGEAHSGERRNRTILADVCEAIIGAVYLDGGFAAASALVERSFGELLTAPQRALRDPKSALQEWAQGLGLPTPAYSVVEQTGPDHAPQFQVMVKVKGTESGFGSGTSKRVAEQAAARSLLLRERIWTEDEHGPA